MRPFHLTVTGRPRSPPVLFLFVLFLPLLLAPEVSASRGDDLPEFKSCVQVCLNKNCVSEITPVPLHLRLFLWTCSSECDYACQHSITASRELYGQTVEQFHGKWPFRRLFGIQEPFSVIFSLLNGYAHYSGLRSLRRELPRNYPLAAYYRWFSYFGMFCWFWSAVFHTRDFIFTERMDYFCAGANVLYGLYYSPIRIFRLYRLHHRSSMRIWGYLCVAMYVAHVYYLQFVRWDYTYNMAANVLIGGITNGLWTYFSICNYTKLRRFWAAWPGLIVTWLIMAMSLELLDFAPVAGVLDAHALWHAATILPAVWWYRFLIHDSRQNAEYILETRAKA